MACLAAHASAGLLLLRPGCAAAAATSALPCAPIPPILPAPLPQGTSKVPLGGFATLQGVHGPQRFSIHKAFGPPDRLPTGVCSEGGEGQRKGEQQYRGRGSGGRGRWTARCLRPFFAPQSCSSAVAVVLVALLLCPLRRPHAPQPLRAGVPSKHWTW